MVSLVHVTQGQNSKSAYVLDVDVVEQSRRHEIYTC